MFHEGLHMQLITPNEADKLLRYPQGRAKRFARRGLIPHIVLPDGEIRFDPAVLQDWLSARANGVGCNHGSATS